MATLNEEQKEKVISRINTYLSGEIKCPLCSWELIIDIENEIIQLDNRNFVYFTCPRCCHVSLFDYDFIENKRKTGTRLKGNDMNRHLL